MTTRKRMIRRAQATFWGAAATATGFAVRHRRSLRAFPVVILAVGAFVVGRAAGLLLLGAF